MPEDNLSCAPSSRLLWDQDLSCVVCHCGHQDSDTLVLGESPASALLAVGVLGSQICHCVQTLGRFWSSNPCPYACSEGMSATEASPQLPCVKSHELLLEHSLSHMYNGDLVKDSYESMTVPGAWHSARHNANAQETAAMLFHSCQVRHTPEWRSHGAAGKESTGERQGPERVRRSFILHSVHSVGQLCGIFVKIRG